MSENRLNTNFDINARCQSMIEEAKKIIKVYLETSNLYEEDGRYNLAYDVKNYLPKLQQENQELRRNISSILNNNGFEFKNGNGELVCKLDNNLQALIKENQELKKQIEADYTSVYLKACEDTKDKYKIQQKEFIKYLEDGIKEAKDDRKSEWDYEIKFEINGYIDAYEEILSRYKEIVGDISD